MHFSVKLQVLKKLEIQTLFMDQANGFSQAEQPPFFFFFARAGVWRLILCETLLQTLLRRRAVSTPRREAASKRAIDYDLYF